MTQTLQQLSAAATQGEWEVDYEYDKDALYSGGGGCGSGFKNYFVGTDVAGKWATLFDTVNSEHKLIEEDYNEDGKNAWDEIGRANAAFIVALVNAYRTGQLVEVQADDATVERVADAIEAAECPGREGPFGGYDYGHNEAFYGKAPEGGRYVIRDFRDPTSDDWGRWVHQTDDNAEHEAMFTKMTRDHIAKAAIAAMKGPKP